MKWIKRLLLAGALLYVLACAVLYFAQERLLFHPTVRPAGYVYGRGAEEITLRAADDVTLSALHYPRPGATGAVLFLHGNTGDAGRAAYQARAAAAAGCELLIPDYRGFGKSGGRPASAAQLNADAQLAYDFLRQRFAEDRISVVGYSLGTGLASHLAAGNDPARLVLVAPYASLRAMKNIWFWMVPDFIFKYDLDNAADLARSRCPVTILHGDADRLIPYTMAEELHAVDSSRIELRLLDGVSHRGVILRPEFSSVLGGICDGR